MMMMMMMTMMMIMIMIIMLMAMVIATIVIDADPLPCVSVVAAGRWGERWRENTKEKCGEGQDVKNILVNVIIGLSE